MSAIEARTTYVLEMPPGLRLLNANHRPHWAVKARITRELRKAAWAIARRDRIPPLGQVRIVVEYQPPSNGRRRDAANWAPTGKALIDGLRDAGVIADDNSRQLVEEAYRIGLRYPRGRMVLHITAAATADGQAART